MNAKYWIKKGRIPIDWISTVPQMRRTFPEEEDQWLGENILEVGLRYNLDVAFYLHGEEINRLLERVNSIWDTNLTIRDLTPTERGYYILFAGGRRFRQCKRLMEEGRWKKRFGNECVDVTIYYGLSPGELFELQAAENSYIPVPPHEAAHFFEQLWTIRKAEIPHLSLTEFAQRCGRNPETIRKYFKFCNLPLEIQGLVKKGQLPYGVAVELARLKDYLTEEELIHQAIKSILMNEKPTETRKRVSEFLEKNRTNQLSLLDIFTQEQRRILEKESKRLIVEQKAIRVFWTNIQYFSRVLSLIEQNKLGREDSPFSMKSPLKAFRKEIEILKRVLAHLKGILREEEYEVAEGVLRDCEIFSERVEEKINKG